MCIIAGSSKYRFGKTSRPFVTGRDRLGDSFSKWKKKYLNIITYNTLNQLQAEWKFQFHRHSPTPLVLAIIAPIHTDRIHIHIIKCNIFVRPDYQLLVRLPNNANWQLHVFTNCTRRRFVRPVFVINETTAAAAADDRYNIKHTYTCNAHRSYLKPTTRVSACSWIICFRYFHNADACIYMIRVYTLLYTYDK